MQRNRRLERLHFRASFAIVIEWKDKPTRTASTTYFTGHSRRWARWPTSSWRRPSACARLASSSWSAPKGHSQPQKIPRPNRKNVTAANAAITTMSGSERNTASPSPWTADCSHVNTLTMVSWAPTAHPSQPVDEGEEGDAQPAQQCRAPRQRIHAREDDAQRAEHGGEDGEVGPLGAPRRHPDGFRTVQGEVGEAARHEQELVRQRVVEPEGRAFRAIALSSATSRDQGFTGSTPLSAGIQNRPISANFGLSVPWRNPR